jgi:hypothetical protein
MRLLALVAALSVAGCGSDDPPASTTDTGTDANETPTVPAASCVRPGDKGNDKGVGEFCTPLGKQCAAFPGAPLCLADVGQDQWMCSRIGCSTDADCGMNATCFKDPKGSGCVPNRCLSPTADTGTDTSSSETSTDAGTRDATDAD